jgi:peptide/nickel transport system substrate-binding protein/oligopeptide transport system substrate-binding protein
VPKEEVDKDPKAFLDNPVGNGPFKMAEPWKHEQYIKTVAFPDFFGDKPKLDGVDFMIFKDDTTAFTEFKAGNLDFTTIPAGQIQATIAEFGESADGYTVSPGKQVLLGSELAVYYYWFNTKDPVMKNLDLRRAIALAINRQAIADTVYEGTRIPATGPVPSGIVGYQKDAWADNKYDVEAAKAALVKAGFPGGTGVPELTISFNTGSAHEKVAQLVQADLAKIGLKTKFDGHEFAEYTSTFLKIENGNYVGSAPRQIMRLGWQADYPIMDNFLYPLFESKSTSNQALYSNPDVDKMLVEARKTTDSAARVKMYQDIEKKIGESMPMTAIVNYRHIRVGSDRLVNFVFSPMSLAKFEDVSIAAK